MPSQVVQPRTSATLVNDDQAVQNTGQRVLFTGLQSSTATVVEGALNENVADADLLHGADSPLAEAIRAFRLINPVTPIDSIGMDSSTELGTPTIFLIPIGAASLAAESGSLTILVGSKDYTINVDEGDDIVDVGDRMEALINADPTSYFTAQASVSGLVLTSQFKGMITNDVGIETRGFVEGITSFPGKAWTPEANVVSTSPEPDLSGILDVVGERRYQSICWGFTDVSEVVTHLDARFNTGNRLQDGVCFHWNTDADLPATLAVLSGHNSQSLVVICQKAVTSLSYFGPDQNEVGWAKAAQFVAIRSLRLTPGHSIAQHVAGTGSLDQIGGPASASLPYFNTPFPNLPVGQPGLGWSGPDLEAITDAGGTIIGTNASGDAAIAGEVVTTYVTDPTWHFLNAVDTMSNAREYFVNNWRKVLAQSRVSSGAMVRGRSMTNKLVFTGLTERLFLDLSGPGFTLAESGEAAIIHFKQNLVVTLDGSRITTSMSFPMVVGMREILASIKVSFNV